MRRRRLAWAAALCLWVAAVAAAQPRLSGLTETRYGQVPGAERGYDFYGQWNLDYALGDWEAGVRVEAARAEEDYAHILQRRLRYRRGGLEAAAGHFYTLAGSGLLLHAFELPGVVTQDRGTGRRYQIVRDLDGARLAYDGGLYRVEALHGTPINSALPPDLKGVDRRRGTVEGGLIEVRPLTAADLGGSLLRLSEAGASQWGANTYARLRIGGLLESVGIGGAYAEVYGEYAQLKADWGRWLSTGRDLRRAVYLSGSLAWGDLGLSVEYKDYRDFNLGDINNPPTLIREHEAFLLNRVTHDILADDEVGTQTELTYTLPGGRGLTANYTTIKRRLDPGGGDDLDSWEFFLQLDSPLGGVGAGSVFFDRARNRILADETRLTFGGAGNAYLPGGWDLGVDAQYQDVDRRFGRADFPFENLYLALEISPGAAWSAGLVFQRSTDALETGANAEGANYWWGANAAWQAGPQRQASLFAGKRRFGLACTGGTCYEVLGFEGVELRVTSQIF